METNYKIILYTTHFNQKISPQKTIMTTQPQTTTNCINPLKKQHFYQKHLWPFSYKKTMAHRLLYKKSKQELTRKWQTFRKAGTQSHRPNFLRIKNYGSGVAEWISSSRLMPQGIIRRGNMKTLTPLLHRQFFLHFFSLFLLLFCCSTSQATEVAFSWSPNSETNLAGYKIYYGAESGAYTTTVDVGNPEVVNDAVTVTLSNLTDSTTYYFAASAYDLDGFESDYSQEVIWIAPINSDQKNPRTDFNGDGMADILVRNADTGLIWLYQMNGSSIADSSPVKIVSLDWNLTAINDFNGDGIADILLRQQSTGLIWMYQIAGNNIIDSSPVKTISLDWTIAATDDFNGDGMADILLRQQSTGLVWMFQMDGNNIIDSSPVKTISLDWTIAATDDFNGDGMADILWRNQFTGSIWMFQMNSNNITESSPVKTISTDWTIIAADDFDGDGMADILLRQQSTGLIWMYQMAGNNIIDSSPVKTISLNWTIASTDDFNGDGMADILLREQSTGLAWMYLMDGSSILNNNPIATISLDWETI